MNTVPLPGVKSSPALLNGERVPTIGEPPWPPGATPAATGIKNLGNTCYMNAVLQCLSHTDIIAEYFVLDHYKLDLLKRNKINSKKYGTRGEVTEQLAALLKSLWACQYSADISTTFKSTVERHGTQYRGSSQHDAQEFLFWLLDKVHEDLNTATKKKYKTIKNTCGKPDEVVAAETLANHARRNSSFVQAVFQAQYRSALTCGRCERTSCTFDPFHCVSVQLPPRHSAAQPSPLPVTVVYVNQQPRQVRIGLELAATATMDELKATLHVDTGIALDHIILAEICDAGWQTTRSGWEAAGADVGQLYCVEAPALLTAPTAPYLLLLWLNMLDGERFGSPYAMQVPREISYTDLQKLLLKEMASIVPERVLLEAQDSDIFRARIVSLIQPALDDEDAYLQSELPHPLFALGVEQALCAHEAHPHLRLELHWDPKHRNSIISECGDACEVHVSAGGGDDHAPAPPPPLTLHACLTHYTRAETLAQEDAWRCPQCQRYMPVVKTLGLWSLPDVLVIHLKRFRQQAKGRSSTKLTTMVEFPLTDFDMTPHLVRRSPTVIESPSHSRSHKRRNSRTSNTNTSENIYDLYAVCYHHGDDLETGHYTAACKNPYDGHWYKFDDSRVTCVNDEDADTELINNTAYMLFYRRKKPHVIHARSTIDNINGHWALRMPKYVKKQKTLPQMNGITEAKEETLDEKVEEPSESEVTGMQTHSPSLSRSASSLPEDTAMTLSSPRSRESCTPSIKSPVKAVACIKNENVISRVETVEINGNQTDEDRLSIYENGPDTPELYIHKDVHVNPKMTIEIPRDSQRPRSVDYPTRTGSVGHKDMNRNYESSPYMASINGVEYDNKLATETAPTTEDLVLSMFHNETKYSIIRQQNRINRDPHRAGDETNVWKTRIST